jgi:hypothetical protein
MRKLIIGALLAATFLAMAVTSASANNLRIDNFERGFKATWVRLEFIGAGATVRCDVTLEGTYAARTIAKRVAARIGLITKGETANCNAPNDGRILRETLPWNVRYRNFTGTLPIITGIGLDMPEARFRIRNEVATCNSAPEPTRPVIGIANVTREGGGLLLISSLRADETVPIALAGEVLCGFGSGRFRGLGEVSVLTGPEFPKITLI